MSGGNIAEAVKTRRLDRAWTQEQLAEIAGIAVRTVQRVEQGHPASLETCKAIAAAFGIDVADLRGPPDTTDGTPVMTQPEPGPDKARYRRHLILFAVISAMLAAINLATTPHHLWFLYPMLGWGVALLLKGRRLASG